MLRFVGNVRAKVTSYNAMPGWVVLFVELFLDKGGDVLFDVVLFQRLGRAVNGVLLHVFRHIGIFNNSFSFGHGERSVLLVKQLDSKRFQSFLLRFCKSGEDANVFSLSFQHSSIHLKLSCLRGLELDLEFRMILIIFF